MISGPGVIIVIGIRPLLLSAAMLATASTLALGQPQTPQRRSVAAVRLSEGQVVTLDGRLDESFWKNVSPATNFMQVDPDNGKPATEQTEVRIVYNADTLYIAALCLDSEPNRWLGYPPTIPPFGIGSGVAGV